MTTREGPPRVHAPPSGDRELWDAARDGDRDAFTALYRRHAGAVWGHAHRLTASRSAAEDVLAGTFLTAWRRRAEVRFTADSALPWLLAVATNEVRTEVRRASRFRRLARRVGPAPDVVDHADAVVTSLDGRLRARRVLDAIAALPQSQRQVVALCLVAEVAQADAARVLGISEPTLRSRLHRARAVLRAALQEEAP